MFFPAAWTASRQHQRTAEGGAPKRPGVEGGGAPLNARRCVCGRIPCAAGRKSRRGAWQTSSGQRRARYQGKKEGGDAPPARQAARTPPKRSGQPASRRPHAWRTAGAASERRKTAPQATPEDGGRRRPKTARGGGRRRTVERAPLCLRQDTVRGRAEVTARGMADVIRATPRPVSGEEGRGGRSPCATGSADTAKAIRTARFPAPSCAADGRGGIRAAKDGPPGSTRGRRKAGSQNGPGWRAAAPQNGPGWRAAAHR